MIIKWLKLGQVQSFVKNWKTKWMLARMGKNKNKGKDARSKTWERGVLCLIVRFRARKINFIIFNFSW